MYRILFVILLFAGILACKKDLTRPKNNDPIIQSTSSFPNVVQFSDSFIVYCEANDIDDDSLFFDWSCTSGASIKGASAHVPFMLYHTTENNRIFYDPDTLASQIDSIRIFCNVRDGKGGSAISWIFVKLKN